MRSCEGYRMKETVPSFSRDVHSCKCLLMQAYFTISLSYYHFWWVLTLPISSTRHLWLWYMTAVQKRKCYLSLKRLKLHFALYIYIYIYIYIPPLPVLEEWISRNIIFRTMAVNTFRTIFYGCRDGFDVVLTANSVCCFWNCPLRIQTWLPCLD
jgi:hypothetical protein